MVAAVMAQPSGSRPEMRDLFYDNNMKGWGPEFVKRRPEITMVPGVLRAVDSNGRTVWWFRSSHSRPSTPPPPTAARSARRARPLRTANLALGETWRR
jgi:hypothetical protein